MLGDEKSITVIVADKDKTLTYVLPRVRDFSIDLDRDYDTYSYGDHLRYYSMRTTKMLFSMRPLPDDDGQVANVTMKRSDNYDI